MYSVTNCNICGNADEAKSTIQSKWVGVELSTEKPVPLDERDTVSDDGSDPVQLICII